MRVGFKYSPAAFGETPLDDLLTFAAQYGASDVILGSYNKENLVPGDARFEVEDLIALRKHVASFGLNLEAIENVPTRFYDQIMLGGPDRKKQIENMKHTVAAMGRSGLPIFGYNWMPSNVWRGSMNTQGRGGAEYTNYDHSEFENAAPTHGRVYDETEMWDLLEDWIRIITPVAEEEGIRMGIHPPDPPVQSIGGIPRLLWTFDAYRRLVDIVDSPSNAIEFCQGTFSEFEDAAGEGIYDWIEEMGRRKKILYVHFRNVSNPGQPFDEAFINTGWVDMFRAMKIYNDVGFDGVFIDDHVPITIGDTEYGHRGRAFANGYFQALMDVIKRDG